MALQRPAGVRFGARGKKFEALHATNCPFFRSNMVMPIWYTSCFWMRHSLVPART
jgi:hypothetical protein